MFVAEINHLCSNHLDLKVYSLCINAHNRCAGCTNCQLPWEIARLSEQISCINWILLFEMIVWTLLIMKEYRYYQSH